MNIKPSSINISPHKHTEREEETTHGSKTINRKLENPILLLILGADRLRGPAA